MRSAAPQFPAVMVLREHGEILFLDRRASELTGCGFGEHRNLGELLACLFPEGRDQARAVKLFRRAAATAGRRGLARFHADFPSKHGRRRRTMVQVQRWGQEPGGRSYLVSFLPSEARVEDRSTVMQGVTRRVARLLEGAVACTEALGQPGESGAERLAVLAALLTRAQGLLGTLEAPSSSEAQGGTEGPA